MGGELAAILRSRRAKQAEERLALCERYRDRGLVFAQPDGAPVKPWNFGSTAI
jgi:hypothetical protein